MEEREDIENLFLTLQLEVFLYQLKHTQYKWEVAVQLTLMVSLLFLVLLHLLVADLVAII